MLAGLYLGCVFDRENHNLFYFIGNSDGFPMKQKGCALARMVDVALQPCSARKVFKPLMIEGDGGVDVGLPTLFFGTAYEYGK